MNALFRLPKDFNTGDLKEGSEYKVIKSGSRFYPISMPVEFCDADYKYLGKVVVSKLEITKDETIVYFKIIKIFSEEESKVFTDNFIKP